MSDTPPDASDPHQLAAEALDLLNEALTLLDAATAHQAAALTDMAINMLGRWAVETPVDAAFISTLVH